MFVPNIDKLMISEVVARIVDFHRQVESEWRSSHGWAPKHSARLLEESRLDRLTSLAENLRHWTEDEFDDEQHDGALILAWANLGALVEGSMKFLLSIWVENYKDDVTNSDHESVYKSLWDRKRKEAREPDGLMLDVLRQFFEVRLWDDDDKKRWTKWITLVQTRRNSIHAYKDRELGDFHEFHDALRTYLSFVCDEISGRLPPPPDRSLYM